jgi:DNA topoisomerase-1
VASDPTIGPHRTAQRENMGKPLVIVESPAKARTIGRFLGNAYRVEASIGHIRDLPESASDIPATARKKSWARLGVDTDGAFEPLYVFTGRGKEQAKKLKSLLADADAVYLATDEDREGEAIAWHLLEVLKPNVPTRRLVFHEITENAIQAALANPRELDLHLVEAQETRRVVDRLYGYAVSPVLWRKVQPRLSAGRVQSVAVRLVVERERARMRFVSSTWWDLKATFQAPAGEYEGRLFELDGRPLVGSRDFDPDTGELQGDRRREGALILDAEQSASLTRRLAAGTARVEQVTSKRFVERPAPPFITSTLQQEANRKLRWSARRTMNAAQRLYEEGWITYMRTDSTQLAETALVALRDEIRQRYGADSLPAEARRYASTSRGAQEAHEAIRPAGERFRSIDECRRALPPDEAALYELIWNRTLACQMKDAVGTRLTVVTRLDAPGTSAAFRTTGRTFSFAGFRAVYVEDRDERPDAGGNGDADAQRTLLPDLKDGEAVSTRQLDAERHDTQPPPRLTDASLVKELETRGIGRPSTYATIIETIEQRGYVRKRGTTLVPTWVAFAVTNLLERHFGPLVDYDFTARLEDGLDAIAVGSEDRVRYLSTFYRGAADDGAGLVALVDAAQAEADPRLVCRVVLGSHGGAEIAVRVGRFGPYLEMGDQRGSLSDELAPDEIPAAKAFSLLHEASRWPRHLGTDPATGKDVTVHVGRFGPHVQLGVDDDEAGERARRTSLLKGMEPETIDLDTALKLLALPRTLGTDDQGHAILASNGRYGPYVKVGETSRSLPPDVSPLDVTREQALQLLAAPRAQARGSTAVRELGATPEGKAVVIKKGRFGLYVTDGETNASLSRRVEPDTLTLDAALELLAQKREAGPSTRPAYPRRGRGAAAPAKAPAKARSSARSKAPAKAPAKTAAESKAASKADPKAKAAPKAKPPAKPKAPKK